ncbi:hypothetical protein [Paraburkholderia caledonica]|uniref:Undecaprenyl pyrophosphate synthase n=1 Tax=Paraburkholderia caledonica TaxID=134536 RepID=A0AB73IPU4_9BURK|nr:undecaprenyl pyrophosphate synthase [Paraburkholderia caledonica]
MRRLSLIPIVVSLSLSLCTTRSWADNVVKGSQVEIVVNYGNRDLTRLHDLEDELDAAARAAEAGQLDGDQVAVDGSRASIYMTARHVALLVKTVGPILKAHGFSRDAHTIQSN